jgi:hypothetical protein
MLSFLMGLCVLGTPVLAEESMSEPVVAEAETQSPIEIEVLVIHATTEHTKKDDSIRHLLKYFANYKYTGYSLIKDHTTKLEDKQKKVFTLPGDLKMMVSIVSHNDKQAKVLVKITGQKDDHKYLDSTMTVPRNGNFMVAGPKYNNGILILPLSVKY